MDPLSRRNLRLTLRTLADEGATVIVSSHILSELSEMCTSLCVMNHGRLLASGSVDEVRRAPRPGRTNADTSACSNAAMRPPPGSPPKPHVQSVKRVRDRVTFHFFRQLSTSRPR